MVCHCTILFTFLYACLKTFVIKYWENPASSLKKLGCKAFPLTLLLD